jgi:hypothetical protein
VDLTGTAQSIYWQSLKHIRSKTTPPEKYLTNNKKVTPFPTPIKIKPTTTAGLGFKELPKVYYSRTILFRI